MLLKTCCSLSVLALLTCYQTATYAVQAPSTVPDFGSVVQPDRSVFATVPREVLRPLIRASRMLRDGDRKQAVALLGEVLSEPHPADYLVPASNEKGAAGVNVSLRMRAQQMLGSFSTADREPYRLRYGTMANQLLETGVEQRDFQKISAVMQRYFYTDAGYRAAMLLGHQHLDAGRSIAAANCFAAVAQTPEAAAIHDPAASVLLATSWLISNSPRRATEALIELKRRQPNGQIEFEGRLISLFTDDATALDWLQQLIGSSSISEINIVNQWLMFGGNPQRNARAGNGFPLMQPRWVVPIENDPDFQSAVATELHRLIFRDAAPIPTLQPLAIGDTIIMRSFNRVVGINFETGKREWVFPGWSLLSEEQEPVQLETDIYSRSLLNRAAVSERLYQDSLYGQSSSDGELIFVVPDPGFMKGRSHRFSLDDDGSVEPLIAKTYNELAAIQLDYQGAFRWQVGGETGLDEPQLAKAFFLGPPLPLDGALYTICQHDSQIKLVVLDPATGKLQWSQPLVNVETSVNVSTDDYRRLAGATPAFADGLLVCPTGAGALVAVELSTRSLRWGYQFTSPSKKEVTAIAPENSAPEQGLEGLWKDSTLMLADGVVLHTPVDAQFLVCVDLETGFPKWTNDGKIVNQFPRDDSLYLATADAGVVVLVGRTSVRGIKINDRTMWEQPTEAYGRPSGRGYANQGSYFLPMTSSQILQIDIASGNIVEVVKTAGVLGNLVCYRDTVISHGADRIAVYDQQVPAQQRVERAIADGKLTPAMLALQSQLQQQAGDLLAAAESITAAYQQSPQPRYAEVLKNLTIELLRTDAPAGEKLLTKHGPTFFADRGFELSAARIEGLINAQQWQLAFAELLNWLKQNNSADQPFSNTSTELIDFIEPTSSRMDSVAANISYHRSSWLSARLAEVVAATDAATLKNMQFEIDELLNDGSRSAVELDDLHRKLPIKLVSLESRLQVLEALIKQQETLRANFQWHQLQLLFSSTDRSMRDEENISKRMDDVAKKLTTLKQTKPINRTKSADPTRATIRQNSELVTQPNGKSAAASDPRVFNHVDFGLVPTEYDRKKDFSFFDVFVEYLDDPALAEYQFRFFGETGEIEVLDGNGNFYRRFLARQDLDSTGDRSNYYAAAELRFRNGLALLNIGKELFAVDWWKLQAGENPVLWNLSIDGTSTDQSSKAPAEIWREIPMRFRRNAYETKLFVATPAAAGVCYLDGNNLVCVDPLTGQQRWQRIGFAARSMVYGDDQHVLVWNQHTREMTVVEIATGHTIVKQKLAAELGALWVGYGARVLLTGMRQIANPSGKKTKASDSSAPKEDEGYRDDPNKLEQFVGLYDILKEEFVWQSVYPYQSLAARVEHEQLLVWPRDGMPELITLADGNRSVIPLDGFTELERRSISGIGVTHFDGIYLLHFQSNQESSYRVELTSRNVELRGLTYEDRFWSGHLVAIDQQTAEPKWEKPLRFEVFQIAKNIPFHSPMYLLNRRVDFQSPGNSSDYVMQWLLFDLATGSLIVNQSMPFQYRKQFDIRWQPQASRLAIDLNSQQLFLDFSWVDDAPPRPLASLTTDVTIPLPKIESGRRAINKEKLAEAVTALRETAQVEAEKLEQQRQSEAAELAKERALVPKR